MSLIDLIIFKIAHVTGGCSVETGQLYVTGTTALQARVGLSKLSKRKTTVGSHDMAGMIPTCVGKGIGNIWQNILSHVEQFGFILIEIAIDVFKI